jgi:hypothetical protein
MSHASCQSQTAAPKPRSFSMARPSRPNSWQTYWQAGHEEEKVKKVKVKKEKVITEKVKKVKPSQGELSRQKRNRAVRAPGKGRLAFLDREPGRLIALNRAALMSEAPACRLIE